MTDLFEAAGQKTNAAEFTVSELSGALKRTVEETFGHVRVRGEISGYRGAHASGHAYFALKDDKARLEAVIWRGVMGKMRFPPEEGMEVIATGKLTTYPGSSRYQIVIESLEPAGAGALMVLLEERKRKLAAEGLFDEARKQLLPFMPQVIGVVTSPTGAVIRDIIHRISDRFPLHILVWPVRVQGEGSGAEVAAAINGFNALAEGGDIPRPDVIIVARGGGSLEDLWGFNDEAVVRAVAQSGLPVISAVGHETDWTLIDYAADRRAPTPTGAAEMAVPVKAELQAGLASFNARLKSALLRGLQFRRQRLDGLRRALPTVDHLLALPRRRFDEAASRLARALITGVRHKQNRFEGFSRQLSPYLVARPVQEKRRLLTPFARRAATAFQHNVARNRQRLAELARLMKTLSYEDVLERGFALVLDGEKTPMKRAAAVQAGEHLTLRFADGEAAVVPADDAPAPAHPRKPKAARPSGQSGSGQGSLF
ncbi:MAG: Exodeoxyribonuclease 7 large subunit [Candidatus Tokpelaia hoelldobleri]|uniref:Exodeoxyribonuclease 7 large subunit n=1 Tax=Candidatus Tokpelaia hoelldobleri TaxID=1902579 RepID=A0A1U9JTD0_9HYPH|nr:MAG: Exodeoxyribonuclease 7 large subunit [Candidatus Tokpelaia hoelldoblerii]